MIGHKVPLRASLHHLILGASEPTALAEFYSRTLGYQFETQSHGLIGRAYGRVLGIQSGPTRSLIRAAYALTDATQLQALRQRVEDAGLPVANEEMDVFEQHAITFNDPDGNTFAFGIPHTEMEFGWSGISVMPARLQHVVFASSDAARLVKFYTEVVGFVVSDTVVDEAKNIRTSFLRCSEEHHSLAVFQAEANRLDHHSYEIGDWGLIRDWGDHLAAQRVPIQWGPGRHGPGNNLFFFIHDAEGNWVELSAELQVVSEDHVPGMWDHEERTLNQWGQGLLRS